MHPCRLSSEQRISMHPLSECFQANRYGPTDHWHYMIICVPDPKNKTLLTKSRPLDMHSPSECTGRVPDKYYRFAHMRNEVPSSVLTVLSDTLRLSLPNYGCE